MTRILILTHYFAPEVGAPQTRLLALAQQLQAAGEQVTVHAPPPHYPTGVVRSPYRNRPLTIARLPDGVRLIRSAVYATPNRGTVGRLANHLSFAASALATAPLSGPQSVIVAETPPLFLAAAAVAYACVKRAALVLHVADRWPASAVALGALRGRRAIAAAERLERWCYRHAAAIVVPTAGMRAALEALPEAAGKVRVIAPAVDLDRFACSPPAARGPLRALYVGTIGLAHGLETLADAAERAGPGACDVSVVGEGAAAAALRGRASGHFHVLPSVAASAVPGLYADADAGIVILRDLPIFDEALPSKLLEVLAAGRPAVLSCRGEAAALIADNDAGLAVAPGDPDALAAALVALAGDPQGVRRMGANARALAERRFARPAMVAAWQGVIENVLTNFPVVNNIRPPFPDVPVSSKIEG
jgi:hypothetical protein